MNPLLRPLTRSLFRKPLLFRPLLLRKPNNLPRRHNSTQKPPQTEKPEKPSYDLTFTCRPCTHRSTHRISKQAYHAGSVLITCPGCSSRHVITDHLKIFGETARSLEDILKEKGEVLKKGVVTVGGDVEFFPDDVDGGDVKALGGGSGEGDGGKV